jgi:mannose-6-phosphate isomerase-like protein (cupin superfamily)
MNPFQLGFRNLFGIILPGAVLVLVLATCLNVVFPDMGQTGFAQIGDQATFLVAEFLLFSYILGSVIRLYSADIVDRLSASLICIRKDPWIGAPNNSLVARILHDLGKEDSLDARLDKLQDYAGDHHNMFEPKHELMKWAWKYDSFPYPVWELMKFRLYHPEELLKFFFPYKRCFATRERRGKEFYNYCKAVIYEAHEGKRHALADEVQSAEANVRFLAGVFWALLLSTLVLVISAIWVTYWRGTWGPLSWLSVGSMVLIAVAGIVELSTKKFEQEKGRVRLFWAFSALAVLLLVPAVLNGIFERYLTTGCKMNFAAICMASVAFAIIFNGRFRLARLKEVDSVFDAFFLVHRHADECSRCSGTPQVKSDEMYKERAHLVLDAYSEGLSLDALVCLMKSRSSSIPMLSSLYFAGADRDHPYFLNTDKIAIGISVLPEDEPKSSESKRHPHQHEVIFVLDGELCVEVVEEGCWRPFVLHAGQVKAIWPGECHRIFSRGQGAVFLFVKTLPAKEPRGVPCSPVG